MQTAECPASTLNVKHVQLINHQSDDRCPLQ